MTEKSNLNPILGYSDTETVKLDFDNTSFQAVKYWAMRTMKWFKLKGFMILKSSEKHYHVVFDRVVSWSENMRIVAWIALQSHNRGLAKWFQMQCIKGCSTLRVSVKQEKPSPRVVYRFGRQDENAKEFMIMRKIIRKIEKKLRKTRDL